jgi:hypothetical protein
MRPWLRPLAPLVCLALFRYRAFLPLTGVGWFVVPWLRLRDANLGQDRGAKLLAKNPLYLGGARRVYPKHWSSPSCPSGWLGRVLANNAHAMIAGACISG